MRPGLLTILGTFAPQNLITFSEQFDNAAWNDLRAITIVANGAQAPDGTTTADKLQETATTASHFIQRLTAVPISPGLVYTTSVYVLPAGRTFFTMMGDAASGLLGAGPCRFDLTNAVVTITGSGCSASCASVGGGWVRCWTTATATGSTAKPGLGMALDGTTTPAAFQSYLGDGASGVYVWGAMMNIGNRPGRYRRNP